MTPKQKLARLVFLLVVGGGLILMGVWFFNTGKLAGQPADRVSVYDQKNRLVIEVAPWQKPVSLNSGSYRVLIQKGGGAKSYFVNIGRMLKTTTVSSETQAEFGREYLATNPQSCLEYVSGVVVSGPCGGAFAQFSAHLPADAKLPPITTTNSSISGDVEDTIQLKNGSNLALLQSANFGNSTQVLGRIELTNNRPSLGLIGPLPWIKQSSTYRLAQYKGGALVYSLSDKKAYLYGDLQKLDDPQEANLPTAKQANLIGYSLAADQDKIAVLFAPPIDEQTPKNLSTEIGTNYGVTIKADKDTDRLVFCGRYLCAFTKSGLVLYETETGKLATRLSGVVDYLAGAGKDYLVDDFGIAEFDFSSLSGNYVYSFGSYKYSSALAVADGVLVNIKDSLGAATLHLSSTLTDKNIDKKIQPLRNTEKISGVSIYKTFIYLSLDLGDPVFDPSINSLSENQQSKNSAKTKIKQLTDQAGISNYTVRVPLLD